jgi:hypothetical protein
MEEKCKNCKFFVADTPQANYGHCHYNAPVVAQKERQPHWPFVQDSDFCGKFQAKVDQE